MEQLEFSQVVTRGGDRGESSLFSGERRRKDDLVFGVMGDCDELSSAIGLAKHGDPAAFAACEQAQACLYELMALVAAPDGSQDQRFDLAQRTADLEEDLARRMAATAIPAGFVLPGKTREAAAFDLARTVCRRAERGLVALIRERGQINLAPGQVYLNRLSDWLFVLARHAEQRG